MDWNPSDYSTNAKFVSDLGADLVSLLSPQRNERILDLGCGDGTLTRVLQSFNCQVLGVDLSPSMVAAARSAGVDAYVADGAALGFAGEFDAVFTNAAMHWMGDLGKVVAGVHKALKPRGRFVGEFGGSGNIASILAAIEKAFTERGLDFSTPWYFPTKRDFGETLRESGFAVSSIELFCRPTPLPGDIEGWLRTFGMPFLDTLDRRIGESIMEDVHDRLSQSIVDNTGTWIADYVRLRFLAVKP